MTLERLIAAVESEMARASDSSVEQVPAPLLEAARRSLLDAQNELSKGNPDGEAALLAPLAHQISDSWPSPSELGAGILSYIHGRRRSNATSRR